MKHFLIYTNVHKDRDLAVTGRICRFLQERGCDVATMTGERDGGGDSLSPEKLAEAECMLVLGGDGTILRAAREIKELQIPILGVNLGTLGFMTEVEPGHIEDALAQVLAGDVARQERMMLRAVVESRRGESGEQWALNDVVISRKGSLQINDFDIYVNGQFLKRCSADGVIVSTPTGTTGYNLSAGGPIAAPDTKLMIVTPICPHTLNQRSIILSPEDKIVIEIPEGREGRQQEVEASFDGSGRTGMCTGDRITITRSEKEAVFLKLSKVSFLENLRRKMKE